MKKILITSVLLVSSGVAQSATLVAGQAYNMNILVDGVTCFYAGNCASNSYGISDNNSDASVRNAASAANASQYALGSSIAGDGYAGIINISTTDDGAGGVNFTVNSFNMDTITGTFGGDMSVWAEDVSAMSGSVDAAGNISMDLSGRLVAYEFLAVLGAVPYNVDVVTGTSNLLTTGISTSVDQFDPSTVITQMGSALQNDLSAVMVSTGLFGSGWAFFAGTQYSEVYSVQFEQVSAVPVPAAVWLFGSGLIALTGLMRRRCLELV